MPYGIPKDAGGDSKNNMMKMKDCVDGVMSKGKDKTSAIRICKASMFGGALNVGKFLGEISEKSEIVSRILEGGKVTLTDEEKSEIELIIETLSAVLSPDSEDPELNAVKFMEFDENGDLVMFTMGPDDAAPDGISLSAGDRLGAALRRKREELGLTQDAVAKRTPINTETYSGIESGYPSSSKIADDVLSSIANALGLDVKQLQALQEQDFSTPVFTNF